MADANLHPTDILKLEFEYARETASQAQVDRTVIVNLFLLLVGGIGSFAIALPPLLIGRGPEIAGGPWALLFLMLGLAGWFTVMKLVRLRQAWHDSVLAMNEIKDYYLVRFPELKDAFRWRTESLPAPGKLWSITFNLALLVMLLDSAAIAVAVHATGIRIPLGDYAVDAFAAVICFAWQLFYYLYQLPTI